MIEFTTQPARPITGPSVGPSGSGQPASPAAGTPGFAAILAGAADPVSEAIPGDGPQAEPAIAVSTGAAPSAGLPESGNILPGAQSVLAAALIADIAPAPQLADSARQVRSDGAKPERKLTKGDDAPADLAKAPGATSPPQTAGDDDNAREGDTLAGLLPPIFSALVAQPVTVPALSDAAFAATSAQIPAQTAPQPIKAAATDAAAEASAVANAAAAAVQATGQGVTNGKGTRLAALDPRVFSLKLERETQGSLSASSASAPQSATPPTDQIIGQRENRTPPLAALANTLAVTANDEARPRASAGAISALALAAGAEAEPDDAAPLAPSLALNGPLIADNPVPAAARGAAPAAERIDFAALVDSVARAREAGASSQDVIASVTHAEFGKVSLRFQNENNGLSVSLMNPDPGFAPAVAAARLADPAFGQNTQGQNPAGSGQQNQGQSGSAQSSLAGDGSASARGGSSQRHDAQPQGRNQTSRGDGPRQSAATGDDLRRGAIWA